MNSYIIVVFLLLSSFGFAQQQPTKPCSTAEYQAFDFWEGDWKVFDSNGNLVGTNKVVKLENGCVLQENWKAANGVGSGTSYNYYNATDGTWNQVWISNTGNVLNLSGNLQEDGIMILKSDLIKGKKGSYYNQITWTSNADGSVTQLWEILGEDGKLVNTAFKGIYKRTASNSN